MKVKWKMAKLRSMQRPPGYVDEVVACAIKADEAVVVVDLESECYKALVVKYGDGRATVLPTKRARSKRRKSQAASHWTTKGPPMWAELHRRPWAARRLAREGRWLKRFSRRVGCGSCARHWRKLLKKMPPDFSSRDAYFAWTCAAHNAVNRRIGKPEMTIEEARRRWTP